MREMMRVRIRFIPLLLFTLLFLFAGGCGNSASAGTTAGKQQEEGTAAQDSQRKKDTLEVHYIDVGQGDATLLKCGKQAMLIDAGPDNAGTALQYYLTEQDVKRLDYVIITHPDADHIGGMDVILTKFNCAKVFMTEDEPDQESTAYRDLKEAFRYKSYKTIAPEVGDEYELGDAKITFLGPEEHSSVDNDNSLICLVEYGKNSFLFTGDAESAEEKTIIKQKITADVYQVGHHGSETSSSKELLDKIDPTYAVISCGANNSYGHPHKSVLDRLQNKGVSVFRTDEQGTIIAKADGKVIKWNVTPSKTWAPGTIPLTLSEEPNTSDAPINRNIMPDENQNRSTSDVSYVLNTNTKKFHLPSCASVSDMKEKNKKEVNWSRDDIIDAGYDPCKRCNP